VIVRAPASTANLGPGFDCAACALDLWNVLEVTDGEGVELEGEGAEELPRDGTHLAVRAFALLAPAEGCRFRFVNRVPLARGLGSSAAAIALGLVAGAITAGRAIDPEELLPLGLELEGHADNLAAALAGGACLTWDGRIRRVAATLPLEPVAVVPETRVDTAAAREALPENVSHSDAAFSAGRAALLGAGLASGDPELLAAAFADRLHEPYRAAGAPLLGEIRSALPAGAVGATLSGSGPTVIVWARRGSGESCANELRSRFPAERVLPLRVAAFGAGIVL
jgi:homoserine kinase